VIRVVDLTKDFGDQKVLKGVSLDIRDNEILVILGPSGQGKTVFIKTLVRLLEPSSGRIEYDGTDIRALGRRKLYEFRKSIAFVFQNSALFDFLDVRQNLALFLKMHLNLEPAEIEDRICRALSFVGLQEEVLEKFPEELSEGMKKRGAIARAMVKRPRYIFYDEPTNGLDERNAKLVSELIVMLKEKLQATSVVVTHDIALMREVADRAALLKDGAILSVGAADDLSPEMLTELYETGDD
jgi:phospholipid/cholesterol/gamma-HCH transport system ATP-binding protein